MCIRDRYKLIWNRFLASQIAPARFKAVNAGISNGDYLFKATGSKMIFDGFLKVYQQGKDGEENNLLPHLEMCIRDRIYRRLYHQR